MSKQFAMVPFKRATWRSKTRAGVRVDAPCQADPTKYEHNFRPWDAHPDYSRCFCGLVRGPRGGLYLVSPIQKITATPAALWPLDELPAMRRAANA